MIREYCNLLKVGFRKRLFVLFVFVMSIALLNSGLPAIGRAFSFLVLMIAAIPFSFIHVSSFVDSMIRNVQLQRRAQVMPFPEDFSSLAKDMGVKVSNFKIIPGLDNAGASLQGEVFFGTKLLEKMDRDQLMCIAAHEFAHIKERHGLLTAILVSIPLLIVNICWSGMPQGLLTIAMFACFLYFMIPASWYVELRADALAVKVVGKEKYISTLKSLGCDGNPNEANESHPSIMMRINHLEK